MVCTTTIPDLTYGAGLVRRFIANLGYEHWKAIKWVFKYLKGTTNFGLCFKKQAKVDEDEKSSLVLLM